MGDHRHHVHHANHRHAAPLHVHAAADQMGRALLLTLLILGVEVFGAWQSHSLALWSDAGHVLTDVAAIGLAWYALRQARRPPDAGMTFGYSRSGILAALFNGVTLMAIAFVIVWQAYGRLSQPQPLVPIWMLASAAVGLSLNLYLGLSMRGADDLNVRSAVLHMLGDAAASAAVIVGALVIWRTHWSAVDPLLGVLIALLIAVGAWRIVRQAVAVLMEAAPPEVRLQEVADAVRGVRGVKDVHDMHVWSIGSGRNALSCHVVVEAALSIRESQAILRELEQRLARMQIGHVTVQTEDAGHPHAASLICAGATAAVRESGPDVSPA